MPNRDQPQKIQLLRWNPEFSFPALVCFVDKNGVVHNPPMPPKINGRLPWVSEPGKYLRKPPLKLCPKFTCRRAGQCRDKISGKFCRKTHVSGDVFRHILANEIRTITRETVKRRKLGLEATPKYNPDDFDDGTPGRELRYALVRREEQDHLTELLKWQKAWVQKMQAAEKLPPKSKH
jgi:hypothetical protein